MCLHGGVVALPVSISSVSDGGVVVLLWCQSQVCLHGGVVVLSDVNLKCVCMEV